MPNTTTPKRAELEERLAQHRKDAEEAESDLGRVTLDGGDEHEAQSRLDESRAAAARTERALDELRGRERAAAEQLAARQQTARRAAYYRWAAEYLRRVEKVIRLRADTQAAEAHLRELGAQPSNGPGLGNDLFPGAWDALDADEQRAARRIPRSTQEGGRTLVVDPTREARRGANSHPETVEHLTGDDRFARLAEQVDALADADENASDPDSVRAAMSRLPHIAT